MRVICAGGRDYLDEDRVFSEMDYLHARFRFTEVVSGGATGADYWGEVWGRIREVPVKKFAADWDKYGKNAGPMRNIEMAKYADMCVLFPGGKGTRDMKDRARLYCAHLIDFGATLKEDYIKMENGSSIKLT